jgi:hypothetical protein
MVPVMSDKTRPKTQSTTIFAPTQRGQERSGVQPGRKTSIYTAAQRHPRAIQAITLAGIGGVAAVLIARRRAADPASTKD